MELVEGVIKVAAALLSLWAAYIGLKANRAKSGGGSKDPSGGSSSKKASA